jgi:hypothetical protein
MFYSLDTPQSIKAKMAYGKWKGMGGAIMWEVSQDDAQGSLVSAATASEGDLAEFLTASGEMSVDAGCPKGFLKEGDAIFGWNVTGAVGEIGGGDNGTAKGGSSGALRLVVGVSTFLGMLGFMIGML